MAVVGPAEPWRARLEDLPRHPSAGSEAGASVLVLLRPSTRASGPDTLLIERAEREGDIGSGQVGLPGGRREPWDGSLESVILREAKEEIRLEPSYLDSDVRWVGAFRTNVFHLEVGAFAAALRPGTAPLLAGNPREVREIFWMPLAHVEKTRPVFRPTPKGPREAAGVEYEGHVVWGFTLRVLTEIRARLGPFAPRRTGV